LTYLTPEQIKSMEKQLAGKTIDRLEYDHTMDYFTITITGDDGFEFSFRFMSDITRMEKK